MDVLLLLILVVKASYMRLSREIDLTLREENHNLMTIINKMSNLVRQEVVSEKRRHLLVILNRANFSCQLRVI